MLYVFLSLNCIGLCCLLVNQYLLSNDISSSIQQGFSRWWVFRGRAGGNGPCKYVPTVLSFAIINTLHICFHIPSLLMRYMSTKTPQTQYSSTLSINNFSRLLFIPTSRCVLFCCMSAGWLWSLESFGELAAHDNSDSCGNQSHQNNFADPWLQRRAGKRRNWHAFTTHECVWPSTLIIRGLNLSCVQFSDDSLVQHHGNV